MVKRLSIATPFNISCYFLLSLFIVNHEYFLYNKCKTRSTLKFRGPQIVKGEKVE